MKIVYSLLIFTFLSSCQVHSVSDWFKQWKETSVTFLASQIAGNDFVGQDKENMLDLFENLQITDSCLRVQYYIEKNETLRFFEKRFKLPRGFLFDGFSSDYNYLSKIVDINKNSSDFVVFSIVTVWKTQFSLDAIQEVTRKIRDCYPSEYLRY